MTKRETYIRAVVEQFMKKTRRVAFYYPRRHIVNVDGFLAYTEGEFLAIASEAIAN